MKVSVVHPRELGGTEIATWREMQALTPGLQNPFLCPEFTLAVGHVRDDARVAVVEDGTRVAGFFPFQRGRLGVARAIGAGVSDCQGMVHATGFEWDPKALLRHCRLAVWEFDHLLADQVPFVPYHRLRERSPVMDLSRGFESYLGQKGRRQSLRALVRKERKLAREHGELGFRLDVVDEQALRVVMGWKSHQYRRTGRLDRFARPWIVELVEALLEPLPGPSPQPVPGRRLALLSMLCAGGRPVAGHLGVCSDTVLSCWFPAYDPELAKYSPGLLLHLHMAEASAARGVACLDLGKGAAEYKELLKSHDLIVAEGWVEGSSPAALLRRARRGPRRGLERAVLERPALRRGARRALRQLGRLRTARWRGAEV